MEAIFSRFAFIIKSQRIITNHRDNRISEFKARLVFTDDSILEFSEIIVFDLSKRKYSFQWMNENYELLIRWDNALHHAHIPTFPHHKHIGNDLTTESSEEMTLETVLAFIASTF